MEKYRVDFLVELTRRKIIEKYIGSAFVLFWIILVPLIPLLTNLLIFYYIAKVPQVKEMGVLGYSVFVLSGLLPYRIFQKGLSDASGLLISNMEMLKSAIFPLSFLGLASLGTVIFEFFIQFLFLMIILLVSGIGLSWEIMLLPVALVFFSLVTLGCIWITAVVGYLLKDIQEVINVVFVAIVYITPTMYPTTAVPGVIQKVINANPLTHMIIVFRDVLLPGSSGLHVWSWLYFGALSLCLFITGYYVTQRVQKLAGDLV
jgi:ABC-type polysaccharide/polyol phosphate export permease